MEVELLIQGHGDEISGLSSVGDNFITCGLDKTLIMWDTLTHKAKWVEAVRSPLTCVALSPDGSKFAAGSQDGYLYYTDVEERSLVRLKICDEAIVSLAFSPDGQKLAFGSKDECIYYFEHAAKYLPDNKSHTVLKGHSSYIKHLDFANDNIHLRSNSADHELLYWNGEEQVTSSEIIDEIGSEEGWSTQNCTLTFDTLGIWPIVADGTDINVCAVYNAGQILAAGDDFGRVRIYQFPTRQAEADCKELHGHADHVKNVAFAENGQIISAGGLERSLLQWASS